MQRATTITRWIVRLAGIIQIVVGLLFWTGHALSLIPLHMLVGSIVVLGLWTLTGLALRAGVHPGLVVLSIALGIALPAVGMTQAGILVGSLHWIIQVVHLALALGTLRLAEGLAELVLRRGAGGAVQGARGVA
jgi:hypothetical protein